MTDLPFSRWLALRETADAQARSADLVDTVRGHLSGDPVTIHDLGCGTGSMVRWLAPRLTGPQHWVMCDRDPALLALATGSAPTRASDGTPVTVETRQCDITQLTAADLRGASLVTASALLDMLTGPQLRAIVAACAGARRPTLLTTSVTGRVTLTPADPLDQQVMAAFNEHQRRTTTGGDRRLGPDAVTATVDAFTRHGIRTETRSAPWRLGPDHADLTSAWFGGWLAAACEQRSELVDATHEYACRRAAQATRGLLHAVVEHEDVLALC